MPKVAIAFRVVGEAQEILQIRAITSRPDAADSSFADASDAPLLFFEGSRVCSRWAVGKYFGYDVAVRRRLFTAASVLSLILAILLGLQAAISVGTPRPEWSETFWINRPFAVSVWIGDGSLLLIRDPMKDQILPVPYWLLAVIACILPAFWLDSALRIRRLARVGRYRLCGYDLTGNASGVCPECGTAIGEESKATA